MRAKDRKGVRTRTAQMDSRAFDRRARPIPPQKKLRPRSFRGVHAARAGGFDPSRKVSIASCMRSQARRAARRGCNVRRKPSAAMIFGGPRQHACAGGGIQNPPCPFVRPPAATPGEMDSEAPEARMGRSVRLMDGRSCCRPRLSSSWYRWPAALMLHWAFDSARSCSLRCQVHLQSRGNPSTERPSAKRTLKFKPGPPIRYWDPRAASCFSCDFDLSSQSEHNRCHSEATQSIGFEARRRPPATEDPELVRGLSKQQPAPSKPAGTAPLRFLCMSGRLSTRERTGGWIDRLDGRMDAAHDRSIDSIRRQLKSP